MSNTFYWVDRSNKYYKPIHATDRSTLETAGNFRRRSGFFFGQMSDQPVERDDFPGISFLFLRNQHENYLHQLQEQVKERLTQLIPAVREEIQSWDCAVDRG